MSAFTSVGRIQFLGLRLRSTRRFAFRNHIGRTPMFKENDGLFICYSKKTWYPQGTPSFLVSLLNKRSANARG